MQVQIERGASPSSRARRAAVQGARGGTRPRASHRFGPSGASRTTLAAGCARRPGPDPTRPDPTDGLGSPVTHAQPRPPRSSQIGMADTMKAFPKKSADDLAERLRLKSCKSRSSSDCCFELPLGAIAGLITEPARRGEAGGGASVTSPQRRAEALFVIGRFIAPAYNSSRDWRAPLTSGIGSFFSSFPDTSTSGSGRGFVVSMGAFFFYCSQQTKLY